MKQQWLEFWVGLFVAAGISALVFLAVSVANQSSFRNPDTYNLTASFNNIGGLKERSPVKSAGVTIGRVTDIHLDTNTYQAVVTMAIEKNYRFTEDTSATILTAGLLGEQYIGLEVGGEIEELGDGGEITLTSSALLLENLIGKFMLGRDGGK